MDLSSLGSQGYPYCGLVITFHLLLDRTVHSYFVKDSLLMILSF